MATPSPSSSASTPPPSDSTPPPPSPPSDSTPPPPPDSTPPPPPPSDSTPPPPPLLDTAPPVSPLPPSTPPPETQPPPSKADPHPGAPPPESPPPPPMKIAPPLSSPPPTPPSSNSPPRESAPPGDSPPQPSANYSPPPDSGPPPSGSYPPPPPRGRKNLSPSPPPTEQMSPPPDHSSSGPPTTPIPHKEQSPPSPPSRSPPPGNPWNFSPYESGSGSNNGVKPSTAVGIGAAVAFAVIFVAVVICCMRKKKEKRYRGGYNGDYQNPSSFSSQQASGTTTPFSKSPSVPLMQTNSGGAGYSYSPPDSGIGNLKSSFTYEELAQATNGFAYQNLLGKGGFGCVYKGFLPDGSEVAVKQLKVGGAQGEREFQAEVEIISRVHHRHLVSLVGYCISEDQRLLVYDYVPNNTLHYHLHGHGRPVMDWETRVKVAAGAARGLAYLHEDCHPRIIHRDIKTSNILIDNNFEAQVSDFGLAKLTADTNTHVTTRVMGTFGYLAPEYASSGKLTDRSDVFSFGVVLLEIITGRRPVDSSQPFGEESLVEWARPLMITALETGKFDQLPDPRLSKNYNEREMFQMIEAASACVRYNAQMRPRMGRVVRVLDSIADSTDLNNGVKLGQTEVFNEPTSVEDMKNFHKMAFGSQDYSNDLSRTSWKS